MKKIALSLVVLAGFASLTACKTQQATYRPAAPKYNNNTPSTTTGPSAPAPKPACGSGKCG